MSLPKYRRGAQLVDAGAVDVDKTEQFWRAATKDIATRGAANAAGKCFFTKLNSKKIKAEFPAVAKEPRRVRAAFLVASLSKEEAAQFLQAEKPALKVATLDRKDLKAPAAAVKEKVVKELTARAATSTPAKKRPKSKSRARLEASRAAVKEKVIKETTKKPAQPAGLQFGPALVEDENKKITIASLLHAGKVFASRTVPAEFSTRFKKYSSDNQLLLYLQGGPNLGQVATYRGWLKQGRQVSKGQHGLKILAPRMVPDKDGNPKIDGLRLVTLFSIDQTEEIKEKKEA